MNHIVFSNLDATLTSSVMEDGRQAACPGEVVTFTCDVTDSATLSWDFLPYISAFGNTSVVFRPSDEGKPPLQREKNITVNLTRVVPHPSNELAANFTSTLTVPAVLELNGSVVECGGIRITFITSCKSKNVYLCNPLTLQLVLYMYYKLKICHMQSHEVAHSTYTCHV